MPNNFHPQDLAHILQTIPTYTTSERISASNSLPTTFQQHIPIGLANIPSTKCEQHTIHATEINKRRRDRWTESKVQQNEKCRKKCVEQKGKGKKKGNPEHQGHTHATQYFRKWIDALPIIHTCTTCMESYPGISTHPSLNGIICNRCHRETNGHHFSKWNNMDPGTQPTVLSILTKVE